MSVMFFLQVLLWKAGGWRSHGEGLQASEEPGLLQLGPCPQGWRQPDFSVQDKTKAGTVAMVTATSLFKEGVQIQMYFSL